VAKCRVLPFLTRLAIFCVSGGVFSEFYWKTPILGHFWGILPTFCTPHFLISVKSTFDFV
jgi:hypothetical protein